MLKLALCFTVLFASVSILFPEFCLSIYSKDIEVIRRGAQYLRVVAPSYLFFGINVSFAASCRNTEHLKPFIYLSILCPRLSSVAFMACSAEPPGVVALA